MNAKRDARLDELLQSLCDNQLTAEEFAELEQRLSASPESRARYREVMKLHGQLAWTLANGTRQTPQPRRAASWSRAWRWTVLAASVTVVIGSLILYYSIGQGQRTKEPPVVVATLVRSIACRWADASESEPVEIRHGDRLALSEGLAELAFHNGSTVVLQGPVDLTVETDRRLQLRGGIVTVTPATGLDGFTVYSDRAEVVDRGTRFGMQVDPDGSLEVHVLEGKVDVRPHGSPERMTQVESQQGLRVDSDQIQRVNSSPERFVTSLQSSRRIVDWGGDYLRLSKNKHLSRELGDSEIAWAAFGNRGEGNAGLLRFPYREDRFRNPELDNIPPGKNGRFLGGFAFWRLDGKVVTRPMLPAAFVDMGEQDSLRLYQANSTFARTYGLWLFPEREFLVRANSAWKFTSASGLQLGITVNEGSHFAVRFVVQSAGKYYLSNTATIEARPFTLSGWSLMNERWAEYHPEKDLRAAGAASGTANVVSNLTHGAGSLNFHVPTSALNDIQAVGIYAESIDTRGWPNRRLEWNRFQVDAENDKP